MPTEVDVSIDDALRAMQGYERQVNGETAVYQTRVPTEVDTILRRIMAVRNLTPAQVMRLAVIELLRAEARRAGQADSSE